MARALHMISTRKNRAFQEVYVLLERFKRWTSFALIAVVTGLSLGVCPVFADDDAGRKVKSKVAPQYPELARKMNLSGTVKVEVVIGPNGTVKSTKVIGGHPLLVETAVDALKKWRYEPASNDTTTTVEFHFSNQ
jgi:TonB family protein